MPVKLDVWLTLGAVALVLVAGSLLRWIGLRGAPREEFRTRMGSLLVWWAMLALLAVSAALGRAGTIGLVLLLQVWALAEYFSLRPAAGAARALRWAAFAALPVHAALIYLDWQTGFLVFLPLFMLLLTACLLVLAGRAEYFVREAAETYWGLMLVGYCLSHLAALSVLPESSNPQGGGAGWFIFLVLLTQANDIVQALFGRRFGSRPLARRLSPKKTWEGFAAGFLATLGLSLLLGAALTPLASGKPWQGSDWVILPGWWPAIAAGCLVSVAGLFGDLTLSGVKRDVGVKDSGTLLPGQGGILDRLDSLLFASPVLFYFVKLLYL